MKIAFIGYGELGVQINSFITQTFQNIEPIYFDDNLFEKKVPNSKPFKEYNNKEFKNFHFAICLGYKHSATKQEVLNNLLQLNRTIFSYIHPTSFVNNSATIGKNSFIYPMCNIDKDVVVGNGVLLNNSVVISHNSTIGNGCYLSPGVIISGNVNIGSNSFLGTGTLVTNGVTIGKNVVVGIGTVVTKNIADNMIVIGNPMKIVSKLNII
ncbi:MAG: DapH/DapD/GlmU-related protein [Bacteroidetes bacterium]|nr:DapH/DapD/GlmU-related protein [Bacteroidota bacterium]